MAQPDSLVTYPERESWMGAVAGQLRTKKSRSLVLGGSIIMLLSTIVVSGVNFVFNAIMARMLGPARFGHLGVANTVLMLISSVSLAFQMVCAKFVPRTQATRLQAGIS